MLGPVVEDGATIEEDHVGHAPGFGRGRIMGEAYALEQAEQVEGPGSHVLLHLFGGEVGDRDDHLAAERAEIIGEAPEGLRRQFLDVDYGRGGKA